MNPDIFVIQECEKNHKLDIPNIWIGDNINKGICIFSDKFEMKVHPWYDPNYKYIIPIEFSNTDIKFTLFAVWKKISKGKEDANQLLNAFNYYKGYFTSGTIIVGDFNNNFKLDKKYNFGKYNFENVVKLLSDNDIDSIYHKLNESHGNENKSTFFLQRNRDKPHHLDYCFTDFKNTNIEIGGIEWLESSDHMPLKITFNNYDI